MFISQPNSKSICFLLNLQTVINNNILKND